MDFWLLGGFVGSVDSGEAFYFACSRFFVKPFWIARLADLQRRVDKDFDEVGFAAGADDGLTDHVSVASVGAYECSQCQNSCRAKDVGDAADAANVFCAVFGCEGQSESLGEIVFVLLLQNFGAGV